MNNIKTRTDWHGKPLDIPSDIELRFNIEPRRIWIETVPHSYLGELFAHNATDDDKLKLVLAYLSEREYLQELEVETAEQQNNLEMPF